MTVFAFELRHNKTALLIWSAAIAFMLGVSVMIYPEMAPQMSGMTDMFADMGSFTAAFGMDQINFGEFWGYFAIECGNVLGLGGAIFAALTGAAVLSKEQKDNTAEFLLTHPISRTQVVANKLLALFAQIAILNIAVMAVAAAAVSIIGESIKPREFFLIFLAYMLMQLEIGCITFAVSAFSRGRGIGAGIGLALGLYFVNILSNLMEELKPLKYLTPFAYADGAYIVAESSLNVGYILTGTAAAVVALIVGTVHYTRKDIL